MRLGLRFFGQNGGVVGQEYFVAKGQSAGWKETVENSSFTHRRQLIQVPAKACSAQLFISSAGSASHVGIYVVSDIVISRAATDAALLNSATFLSKPTAEWIRDGDLPEMAQLIGIGSPDLKNRAFCLLDDSPLAHAEWHQQKAFAVPVNPGERLILQWNEMFNIGDANSFTIAYSGMLPGHYRFRVNELDTIGRPTPKETVIDIVVPQPLWKNPWLWAIAFSLVGLSVFHAIRALVRRKFRRKLEQLQREGSIEQERLRISRDIHDDMGARLTQISLFSGMAAATAETEGDGSKFKEISGMACELVSAMYETVWAVNPKNDNLESLVSFLLQSTQNQCKPSGIRCRINDSPIRENRQVHSQLRHNVSLAVKEAVHNAIKHARATEIQLSISFEARTMEVMVADDGCGFPPSQEGSGHGMDNLNRRMEAIGGSVRVSGATPSGTRVEFRIPLP